MKTKITLLLFIFSISVFAQNSIVPLDDNGHIIYTDVVLVDSNISAKELHAKAKMWMANAFVSSKDIIQLDDEDNHIIVGKASMPVTHRALGSNYPSGHIHYTLTIQSREGRYRYIIENFHHTGIGKVEDFGDCDEMINTKRKVMGFSYQKQFNGYLEQLNENMEMLILSLKKSMANSPLDSKDDDW